MRVPDPDNWRSRLPLVLTADETARLLRVGRDTVYAGIHAGTIPAVWISPRRVVVPTAQLLALLDGTNKQGEKT